MLHHKSKQLLSSFHEASQHLYTQTGVCGILKLLMYSLCYRHNGSLYVFVFRNNSFHQIHMIGILRCTSERLTYLQSENKNNFHTTCCTRNITLRS